MTALINHRNFAPPVSSFNHVKQEQPRSPTAIKGHISHTLHFCLTDPLFPFSQKLLQVRPDPESKVWVIVATIYFTFIKLHT